MTIELILIMAIWAYILLGVFFGDLGPVETFRKSGPRLAARIEKDLAVGHQFKLKTDGKAINWENPKNK